MLGIPFETFLPDNFERDSSSSLKSLPYLFIDYNIRYTAGSILSNASVKKIRRKKLSLAILIPDNIKDLFGTNAEIRNISESIKNTKIFYLSDNKARADSLVFKQNLLHISGHINVDFDDPFNSRLSNDMEGRFRYSFF